MEKKNNTIAPHGTGEPKFDNYQNLMCSCDKNPKEDDHSCPYQEDINGDYETLCNCCSDCTQNCCDDI